MWFHNGQGPKPPHRSGACTDCFTQGLKRGRVSKGSPWSCLPPAAAPCHLLVNTGHFDTSPLPPHRRCMMDIHGGGKPAPPCCSWARLLILHRMLPTPGGASPCQPAETSPLLQPPPQPSWHLSPLLCHRSLQDLCLTGALSKGCWNQSLTPLTGETLGPFKKLYGWIFVATWSSLYKAFRDGED